MNNKGFSAILLAGERPGASPVALAAGVACKALAPVGGRPMLARVLDTLLRTGLIENCLVVGNHEYRNALQPVLSDFGNFAEWHDGADSPARSAALAASQIPAERRILLTTADHPLLTVAMIAQLCGSPEATSHDIVAGVVRRRAVLDRYPDARCTALRFSDDEYCGTNLFLFATARGRRLMDVWQKVEAARKTPWRVVSLLGPVAVLAYLTRRLSLPTALATLSSRVGLTITATVLDDVRAALDVDTVGDWQMAKQLTAPS